MTASLPQEISEKILMRSDEFLLLVSKVLDEPPWLFALVDKDHPLPTGRLGVRLFSLLRIDHRRVCKHSRGFFAKTKRPFASRELGRSRTPPPQKWPRKVTPIDTLSC